jgi:hypothetical protein
MPLISNINRMLNAPYVTMLGAMLVLLAIMLFQLISNKQRADIRHIGRHPISLIIGGIVVIFVSNFNAALAFILLGGMMLIMLAPIETNNEGFDTEYEKMEKRNDRYVKSIKNIITGDLNSISAHQTNELKRGMLENKQRVLEKKQALARTSTETAIEATANTKEEMINIGRRVFNPMNAEDTNLLITKEILEDMINRIEYDYEPVAYLRGYLKGRIEELITTNDFITD